MQLLKYIPLQLTFCLVLGIFTGFFLNLNPIFVIVSLVTLLSILGIFYLLAYKFIIPSIYFTITALLSFYLIGITSITIHNDLNNKKHYTKYVSELQPRTALIKVESILKANDYYDKYVGEVLKIEHHETQGKILLNINKDSLQNDLNVDDVLVIKTNFELINGPKNPYQFNYKFYLEKQNIYRQITTSKKEIFILDGQKTSIKGLAHKFRIRINQSLIKSGFNGDELAIINALLLGQRQEMSKEILENYTKAGAVHILAVSGLHVGIILLIITVFLKPLDYLKHGKLIKLIITLLLLWTFAFIAGLSASVVRAVTMFTALSIGLAFNRKNSLYKNLIISVFFLLLFNPYYLFEVGFQLSYLAVFFIVWLQPIIYSVWKPSFKPLDYFWQLFTVSVAAQIGVLPLSLYYFHQFPGLFFVANLLIIPVLGLILGLGIAIIFFSLINLLPKALANFYQGVIDLMNHLIAWIADQESFLFQEISFSLLLMLSIYLFIIFCFRWIENKTVNKFKYVLVTIVLIQVVFIFEEHKTSSYNELVIFNKSKASALAIKENYELRAASNLDLSIQKETFKDYIIGSGVSKITMMDTLKNVYQVDDEKLLIVDSLGIYRINDFVPDMVLLSNSPKINLERMIDEINPNFIIADASNFKSYVLQWEKTCINKGIKFYYTAKEGAYVKRY